MGAAPATWPASAMLRIAISYNSFDVLEDGYGINLRPLSMYQARAYHNDKECLFRDSEEISTMQDPLAAKMAKVIAIIQFKVVG